MVQRRHTPVESNELTSTTRGTALRGAGLVGVLALGVGSTGASQANSDESDQFSDFQPVE